MSEPSGRPGHAAERWAPSELRRRVLEDHARLRPGLRELRAAAEWARTGDPERRDTLRREAADFAIRFFRHLEMEEQELVPVLRRIDAWGDERARRVIEEHVEQRGALVDLLAELDDPSLSLERSARRVLEVVAAIEADMIHEEETVLHENLLRDDVVSLDASGD